MAMQQDEYTKRAIELIGNGMSLFITGKAGTGKTTLLRHIYDTFDRKKKIAIVAPTGVAAKQAEGVTIHSLLHLPLGPYIPNVRKEYNLYCLSDGEEEVIREMDMLIIDEVSMVRCDLLDEMDDVISHYRRKKNKNAKSKPFGGIQVIMFGDLHQLMPVAPKEEWDILKTYYKSPYFFSSDVYTRLNCPMLELTHIYRQNDVDFINLLNNVRDGFLTPEDKRMLESRYKENFVPKDEDDYIRVTTHNRKAKKYNQERLEEIDAPEYEYKASISGKIPFVDYPTDPCIVLKVGARVMFIRNDNVWNYYVNGTLGTVTHLDNWFIQVQLDNGQKIEVERANWDFERYKYNKFKKILEIEHYGEFKQYPLKLAWCVTIHKSQGLTFDKVVIDAGKAFTYGQVYVALSRCRHFDGIVCVSKIKDSALGTDPIVLDFMEKTRKIAVTKEEKALHQHVKKGKETSENDIQVSPKNEVAPDVANSVNMQTKKSALYFGSKGTKDINQNETYPEPAPERKSRWSVKEVDELVGKFKSGSSFSKLEKWCKGRTMGEITTKLKSLGLITWNERTGEYVRIKNK